ncbi:MAG: hypothetical protein HYV95_12255 [Opitutae bacterium]|nr:hypothetical protein [Opitutae bacterium]
MHTPANSSRWTAVAQAARKFRARTLWLAAAAPLLAAPETVNQIPIDLPEYKVQADRELPPPESWSYARIEGFEVLSNASEGDTQRLLADFQRFTHALSLVWPGMQPDNASPAALIVCGQGQKFEEFLPDSLRGAPRAATAFSRRERERATLVLDQQTKILNLVTADGATTAAGADSETESTESTPDLGFTIDANQQLYREYIRFLLSERQPPHPVWFAEGLSQLFMNLRITETEISIGRVENPNLGTDRADAKVREDRDFNVALANRALLPLDAMFALQADSALAQNPIDNVWAKQCYAFVHWGLYGDYGRHQREFLTFVNRAGREPLTEALFKECFKLGYDEMLQALRGHIEFTRSKVAGVQADKGQKIPAPPPVVVREATEAEIGRLKGEAFALAGHPAAALEVLILSYRRGERDSALLASLGLAELAGGDTARARKLLEKAVAGQVVRPRAYLELARLRLAEGLAQPKGGQGKLSSEQTAGVLEPLFAARTQPPALAEIYELMAEAWTASAFPPTAAHLAAVEQGVKLFPRNTALVYRAADLRAQNGFPAEAHGLVRLGLKVARDEPTRAKFEQLQARLPALAPAQPK